MGRNAQKRVNAWDLIILTYLLVVGCIQKIALDMEKGAITKEYIAGKLVGEDDNRN